MSCHYMHVSNVGQRFARARGIDISKIGYFLAATDRLNYAGLRWLWAGLARHSVATMSMSSGLQGRVALSALNSGWIWWATHTSTGKAEAARLVRLPPEVIVRLDPL